MLYNSTHKTTSDFMENTDFTRTAKCFFLILSEIILFELSKIFSNLYINLYIQLEKVNNNIEIANNVENFCVIQIFIIDCFLI